MGARTGILWTDSTFNPWWGCTKVSPGCDNCYAEAMDIRVGGSHWGDGSAPREMSDNYWREPFKWNKRALREGVPLKVFSGSMCDVFDKNAPAGQRDRLFGVIRKTEMLRWQLLTKRAKNIAKFLPGDWGDGYENVWLGVSVENRRHGLARLKNLVGVPAKVRFLSVEPLLENLGEIDLTGIHWVIVGGESGNRARPIELRWVERIRAQCIEQSVPFFFKQWGGKAHDKGGCLLGGVEIKEWPVAVNGA